MAKSASLPLSNFRTDSLTGTIAEGTRRLGYQPTYLSVILQLLQTFDDTWSGSGNPYQDVAAKLDACGQNEASAQFKSMFASQLR